MSFVLINPRRIRNHVKKSAESEAILNALNSYLEDHEAEPVKWLVTMWKDQGNAFGYSQLESIATDEMDPQGIFDKWFQDYSSWVKEKMTDLWQEGFIAGAKDNPWISGLGDAFNFDTSSTNVREWIIGHGGDLITRCTNDQIEAIRYIIAESRSVGMGSLETARYIRPLIGLTQRQSAANLRFYNNFKTTMAKDHPRMTAESIEQKARAAASRYAARQQRYRAQMIARTENAFAYNRGNDEAIRQAQAKGLLPHLTPYWTTAMDGHVCDVCEDLEGQQIGDDGEFTTTYHGREYTCDLPPMHPNCKCCVEYRED